MELNERAGRLVSVNCNPCTSGDLKSPASDETDLPPELCHYPDEGCELANSCLNCPFPKCAYDQPGGRQRLRKRLRDREVVKLFAAGLEMAELAVRFGVSLRTIYRALRRARNE